ncbi:ATPase-like, ATP-binding domain protein [Metarhizium album ARSEF 1941]|uniref:histidine kinase n=1 Tax=Metarhizium album (strain ARSEF 1941) TaxID=1081103 RepID=A0A0B2X8P2_METAS|nr:ATPase-like, ATP-binding domain protein [Metarhizium album ARSEF 1941]KHO01905.1 ATPase-like, ATP-binding domain protein [Metarhizium album ARSEF 1941]
MQSPDPLLDIGYYTSHSTCAAGSTTPDLTRAAAEAAIEAAAVNPTSPSSPSHQSPPTCKLAETSAIARDGVIAGKFASAEAEEEVGPADSSIGHAPTSMAQRRSSYPFSSASDLSSRGQREWQSPEGKYPGDEAFTAHQTAAPPAAGLSPPGAAWGDTASTVLATSQQQLNEYRARLARDLEIRELSIKGLLMTQPEKPRVSPIWEEGTGASCSPMLTAALTTTSTESGNTVRGGTTTTAVAQTPSYPFPRMAGFPPHQKTKPVSHDQPAVSASPRQRFQSPVQHHASLDKVLSQSSTPASSFTFEPPAPASEIPHGFDFPSPNLYDLSLMLSAEPGLDAWWNTVVQIMRDIYKAERVTLAVPADTTDIENVPWGQKATYNEHQEDELSLGYLARANSASDGAVALDDKTADSPATTLTLPRPGLRSRHSFTAFEENKLDSSNQSSTTPPKRPATLSRSKTQYPSSRVVAELHEDYTKLNKDALDEHDATAAARQAIPSWEAPFMARYEGQGQILPVLQALDYEADPLIDHAGVMRVLERGRPVALTRTYPYLPRITPEPKPASEPRSSFKASSADPKRPKRPRTESASKLSTIFAGTTQVRSNSHAGEKLKATTMSSSLDDHDHRPPTPKYEEYEQAPPSPWSQSPAPSPAVRADPKENPFFTDAMVDEDSFNPGSPPTSYTGMRPPEAIGVDNSWTVLHIPLTHVLLSKPTRSFKLDTTVLEQKTHLRSRDEQHVNAEADQASPRQAKRNRSAPIAIVSILSPVIPYPSNLRNSLEHLAPHMATSFSLCRHYSNLETELAGIRRRRPSTTGFGAVAPFGSHVDGGAFAAQGQALVHQNCLGGSITSPSDYSALSKSTTASPLVTPGWEHGSLNHLVDRRQPLASPSSSSQALESYFATKQRLVLKEASTSATQRPRTASKDGSPGEKRNLSLVSVRFGNETVSSLDQQVTERSDFDAQVSTTKHQKGEEAEAEAEETALSSNGNDGGASESTSDRAEDGGRAVLNNINHHRHATHHGHSVLHSYGADFSSTFQSLPPSSSLSARLPPAPSAPPRSGSMTSMVGDMPPPSDRLKGLILDSLPAHVFVSLPQTGETVWVNSRFLSYRGQTVADLSADPWGSIHPEDREGYLKAWGHSLRTGEQFSRSVRIKRFDGAYRWFYARAVASKDKRGVIMQFLGSYMDIHDQHIAELKAARQEEIEASEAKHRLLANLIPQIIFTATEDDAITFANDQWLSYTGQRFEDSLGLGFMNHVHPDDLARCRIPIERGGKPSNDAQSSPEEKGHSGASSSGTQTTPSARNVQQPAVGKLGPRNTQPALSRASSSGSESVYSLPSAELTELARKGIIKVTTDTSGRLSYTTEVRLRSKTGEYRWHLIRCVEIDTLDFGRGASSYFGSATDINDHKLLEAKLKEAMESKGRFLSNMSHEIRTPLIGISGMVSFLQDTTLNEEQRDYTNTIQTSANSLIMIINDILDLSKVDAGMMKLKHEWFHTRSLIEDVNELVSTMAIAKRLELNYLVEADVPAWVKGDKVRIRQVLLNVIGNAIKFTAEGEVFSRCRVYTEEDPAAACNDHEIMLQFAITDTGRGFTKEEAELIFKPFSQIDGSSTRQHGGSGLGLVISRQLVELHGGKMEGTAIPGKGSTFTFTARFTLPSSQDHPNIPISPGSTASAGSRQESSENANRSSKGLPPPTEQLRDSGSPEDGASAKETSMADAASSAVSASTSGVPEPGSDSPPGYLRRLPSGASGRSGLTRFSEAAKASGQDLSQIKLEMPADRGSPSRRTASEPGSPRLMSDLRPPLYSILIICAQHHSREATAQHIEMTLPKDVPHRITAIASVEDAEPFLGGEDSIRFTHIVLNLASAEAIIDVMDQITKSQKIEGTTIVILCDSVQRQALQKLAADTKHERFLSENLVTFIYKPVKPSRFAVIFDPEKVRDLSTDRNRSTAQQMVENQKASYQEIEKRMGNKGYRVLLVEDNPVNQKVLIKYLKKIGVEVEVAVDGVECTEIVLSKPHSYYSLILCDLHMPRKDGYQACREVREWEKASSLPKLPIIALSANVMSDVQEKCVAAGFSDYVTKPVDFIDLSRAMAKFF